MFGRGCLHAGRGVVQFRHEVMVVSPGDVDAIGIREGGQSITIHVEGE